MAVAEESKLAAQVAGAVENFKCESTECKDVCWPTAQASHPDSQALLVISRFIGL